MLAAQGIAERRRATPRPRGLKHAIGALIVASFVVGVPVLRSFIGGDPGLPSNSRPVSAPVPPGGRLEFPDLNFAFDVPAAPWVQVDAEPLNPLSCLAFLRSNPQVFFIVIAEAIGNTEFGTEGILAIARGNVQSATPLSRLSDDSPEILNGTKGTSFRSESSISGHPVRHTFWVHAKNGYCYQLVAWAAQSVPEAALDRMARELRSGFRVIDPDRRSRSDPSPLPPVSDAPRIAGDAPAASGLRDRGGPGRRAAVLSGVRRVEPRVGIDGRSRPRRIRREIRRSGVLRHLPRR